MIKAQYRTEIDGLRAVAVLAVIFLHAGFADFAGGFAGVDVFFVISGFLITQHLMVSLSTPANNYKELLIMFWEKRMRRIIPALYCTLICSSVAAWLLLLPSDRWQFMQSLLATVSFSNNALLAAQIGYFDNLNNFKPLMHTWSLAIEEQYYLLFPLFLLGIYAIHRRFVTYWQFSSFALVCVVTLLASSLCASQYYVENDAAKAYFLTQSRAFELLIGSATAIMMQRKLVSDKHHEMLAWVGVAMIGYALFSFDHNTAFPAFNALIPTIGTGLLLFYIRPNSLLCKALSTAPLVFIGKISYSAYLIHQPVFAFLRHYNLRDVSQTQYMLAIITVLMLATFSWRYVEQPFRNSKQNEAQKYSRKQIFRFTAIGAMLLFAVGYVGCHSKGTFFVVDNHVAQTQDFQHRTRPNYGLHSDCEGDFTLSPNCRTGENPQILLWGDSFAMHLADMLKIALPNVAFQQNTVSSCGPVFGMAIVSIDYSRIWSEKCIANNDKVLAWLRANKSVRYVVLGSTFIQYVEGNNVLSRDGSVKDAAEIGAQALLQTLDKIKSTGAIPIIIAPPPQDSFEIGKCLLKAKLRNELLNKCDILHANYLKKQKHIITLMQKIDLHYQVIWLDKILCDGQFCKVAKNNILIYRDREHLSHEGSAMLGRLINAEKWFPLLVQ